MVVKLAVLLAALALAQTALAELADCASPPSVPGPLSAASVH
jgi:hypothetical protein